MRNRIGNVLWGLFFIVLGVGIGGKAFGYWDFHLFFPGWWTLFLIIPCMIDLVQKGIRTGSMIGLLIGLLLLAMCQGYLSMRDLKQLLFPIIFIIIGCSILVHSVFGHKKKEQFCQKSIHKDFEDVNLSASGEVLDYCATFQGQTIRYDNEVFYGAVLNSVFGGIELVLDNAVLTEDVKIDCSAIFGGITIHLPEGVNTKVKASRMFGGVNNRRKSCQEIPGAPTIFIEASCMFGGVEIK